MKRPVAVLFLLAMLTCGALAISANYYWVPIQVWYHTRALDRIHHAIWSNPEPGPNGLAAYGSGDLFEQEDRHKQRLVELGYFFHKQYPMESVPDTGEAHRALWRLIQDAFPNSQYPALSYPDNVLEVWDLAELEPTWDAFALTYNVPELADRFHADGTPHEGIRLAENQSSVSSTIPATDLTTSMVGRWGIAGEESLIITLDGDQVVISAPDNEVWSMRISDARIDGRTVQFVQTNFLKSGEFHPFNGVACKSVVRLVTEDSLQLSIHTKDMPEPASDLLIRME